MQGSKWLAAAILVGVISSGTACSSPARQAAVTTTTAVRPGPTCARPTVFGANGAAPNEVHGTSANGELWGLAVGPGKLPLRGGDEMKIVWRMTGTGPLHIVFRAPDGRPRPLVLGPQAHTNGSTYRRPGDEWGTGLRFSTPGCWHIHLTRDDTAGDVWLAVGPPRA